MLGPLYIVFIGAFGLPAVFVVGQFAVAMARVAWPEFAAHPYKVLSSMVLCAALVGLCVPYVFAFIGEFGLQVLCEGAGCAQGGAGLMMVTPLSWLSCALMIGLERLMFDGRFLPRIPSVG